MPVRSGIGRLAGRAAPALFFAIAACARARAPVTSASAAASAPQAAAFPEPPVVVSRAGVARVALRAVLDAHTLMPAFSFAGTTGRAPTIRVRPGDRIEIAFTNALPANDAMGSATNLHFHGLVVAPSAPGDDTLRTIAYPGQTLHYTVRVGREQQPGLYWYHPHAHGNTLRQVGLGGMSGAIVVEGIQRAVPALGRMRERLLVVRDVSDSLDTNELRGHPELAPADGDVAVPNVPCRRTGGTHVTVNGERDPSIPFVSGETQFFRVLNATGTRFLDLSLGHATLRMVAIDGIALDAYPGASSLAPFSHAIVAPGGRVEFTVSGALPGDRLASACYDAGPDGDADPAVTLATIARDAAPATSPAPPPAIPVAARGIRNPLAVRIPAPVRDRTVTFTEINRNGASTFAINGASYDPQAPALFTIRSGTIERWKIVNESLEAHAFHIHQVHFVPISIDGRATPRYWLDTLAIPAGRSRRDGSIDASRTVMLVDFRDAVVRGTFVFHCHLLDHEDGGMMAKVRVV